MIFDCALYNGEIDLLRIRMAEMQDLDVVHVLVDSPYTFSGQKKSDELRFIDLNKMPTTKNVFCRFELAIEPFPNPWDNERTLRNHIATVLTRLPYGVLDTDTIIISDLDEIPRASAVLDWSKSLIEYSALMMDKFGFFLNLEEQHQGWHRARIMRYSYLKSLSPEVIRNAGFPHQVDNAGWHFSYCGGVNEVLRKFASFSHQEPEVQKHANRKELIRKMAVGESIWGNDLWSPVPITELPKYVQDHQEELSHLIFKP